MSDPVIADLTAPDAYIGEETEGRWGWQSLKPPQHGLSLGLTAYALALAGTLLLGDEPRRVWGEMLVALGAVLAVFAWASLPTPRAFAPVALRERPSRLDAERVVRLSGIVCAALLIWLANVTYLNDPGATFGLAGWLWLAAMALLVGMCIGWPRNGNSASDNPSGLVVRPVANDSAPWPRWEWAVLGGIFLLAFAARTWDLTSYPFAIHPDEILTGGIAKSAYSGFSVNSPIRSGPSIFGTLWTDINLPAFWFYLVEQSLKLGGSSLASLRFPAALFGALTVLPVYGLVRGAWGRWAAITSATIMAASVSNVHFSRVTLNNIVTQFFWASCFYFLLRGLRLKRPLDWVLAGIAAGLGEHFYYGTRLLIFVLSVFLLYLLVTNWRQAGRCVGLFALTGLGFLAGFGPLLAYFTQHPNLYFGRGAGVLTWSRIPTSWDDFVLMWSTLWPLFANNLLGISAIRGEDSVYWSSLLLPAEAALLALGVGLLVRQWRYPPAFLVLLSGLGVLLVGGTLVHGTPFIAHWTPAFPAFYAAVGLPVGAWLLSGPRPPSRTSAVLRGVVVGGLATLVVANLYLYFARYQTPRPEFEIRAVQSRYQASLGPDYRVFGVGETWQQYDADTNSYLISGQEGAQLLNPSSQLPVPGQEGKGLAFFSFPDNDQYRAVYKKLYPGGREEDVKAHEGTHLFYAYVVPPEKLVNLYGVRLRVLDAGRTQPINTQVGAVGVMPTGLLYPAQARWSGAIYFDHTGNYRLNLSDAGAKAMFDGRPTLPNGAVVAEGWHRFVIDATLQRGQQLKMSLVTDAGSPSDVPATHLWPEAPGKGLLGVAAGPAADQTAYRVDPYLGFNAANRPSAIAASPPTRARWTGQIVIRQEGDYAFSARTDGQASLTVDGRRIFTACASSGPVEAAGGTHLIVGWHQVQIEYIGQPGQQVLEWYWQTPGEPKALVPPEVLRYIEDNAEAPAIMPAPPDSITCQ